MQLQEFQTNVCSLIKSRPVLLNQNDRYLSTIKASQNLLLIRKIALWWRKIQIENSCVLTTNLLKISGRFQAELSNFFSEQKYSAFREEVCIQFLQHLISKKIDVLTTSVAMFELAIIKLKFGVDIETQIPWQHEPYAVIQGLLKNNLTIENLEEGNYNVAVSYKNKEELFTVNDLCDLIKK